MFDVWACILDHQSRWNHDIYHNVIGISKHVVLKKYLPFGSFLLLTWRHCFHILFVEGGTGPWSSSKIIQGIICLISCCSGIDTGLRILSHPSSLKRGGENIWCLVNSIFTRMCRSNLWCPLTRHSRIQYQFETTKPKYESHYVAHRKTGRNISLLETLCSRPKSYSLATYMHFFFFFIRAFVVSASNCLKTSITSIKCLKPWI